MEFLGTPISDPQYRPVTAWLEHGPFATWLVRRLKPRRIVELGTHFGYSYFAMCQSVAEAGLSTECIAIDLWRGDEHAGFYDDSVYESVVIENDKYKHFSRLIRSTFADALLQVEDGSVDLLHVDGRHFYDDVREDFENWRPKLSAAAVVLFHDTEVRERDFGVYRYWPEVSGDKPAWNFRHEHGLGVLFWGDTLPEGAADLIRIAGNNLAREATLAYFADIGGALRIRHEAALQQSALQVKLSETQTQTAALEAEWQAKVAERQRRVSALEAQLVQARQTPLEQLWRLAEFRLLRGVAKLSPPLPRKTSERLVRMAAKRDPQRNMGG